MKYIAKSDIASSPLNPVAVQLNEYILTQISSVPEALHPRYDGIPNGVKEGLVAELLAEQMGLCCYCMSSIEEGRFHIEHLAPQSGYKNEEVQYYNLFLSCGSKKENLVHCGHIKRDYPIPKLISYFNPKSGEKCEDYFKYNLQGEILPKQGLESMSMNIKKIDTLNPVTKLLIGVIEILNLNCDVLKSKRKSVVSTIMGLPDDQAVLRLLAEKLSTPDERGFLQSMVPVAIHFINLKINKLT